MVVYEVNLEVDAAVAEAYAAWLAPHVGEVLAVPGFVSAEWWAVEDDDRQPGGAVRWCVQYRVESRAALQTYFDEHADRLRGDGLDRFGGRFRATRRVLLPRDVG
jgi:hypothetical protein